jgi:hypothetical protein
MQARASVDATRESTSIIACQCFSLKPDPCAPSPGSPRSPIMQDSMSRPLPTAEISPAPVTRFPFSSTPVTEIDDHHRNGLTPCLLLVPGLRTSLTFKSRETADRPGLIPLIGAEGVEELGMIFLARLVCSDRRSCPQASSRVGLSTQSHVNGNAPPQTRCLDGGRLSPKLGGDGLVADEQLASVP